MIKRIFLDTETTDTNMATAGLWQIGAIIECGKRIEEVNLKFDIFEGDSVDPKALELNGITLDKIASFDDPAECHKKFLNILDKYVDKYDKKDKFQVFAYGAEFDSTILRNWFWKNEDDYFGSWFFHPWIDVMNMAATILQEKRKELQNFKLGTVAEYFEIKRDGSFHDALFDAHVCRDLYNKLQPYFNFPD